VVFVRNGKRQKEKYIEREISMFKGNLLEKEREKEKEKKGQRVASHLNIISSSFFLLFSIIHVELFIIVNDLKIHCLYVTQMMEGIEVMMRERNCYLYKFTSILYRFGRKRTGKKKNKNLAC
jgi:hypothetical protein